MIDFPTPIVLEKFWYNSYNLKQHLKEFLHLDSETLDSKLETGFKQLAELGKKDFDWESSTDFYRDKVNEIYLFELGSWHLASQDYIGNTLRLVADQAKGRVLDFGGGIGTHTISAALCPDVDHVVYCDINPVNTNFVQYRAEKLNLSDKITFCTDVSPEEKFDTIMTFDVVEHLAEPQSQLLKFYHHLTDEGRLIINWYFFKGFNNEFPFHHNDVEIIDSFFKTLQSHFLEVFHPYLITGRCYKKWVKMS
jgi:2-polyprenyl-3-methyl-5-hydroxy-6-metoxy-1,4-benzoquinol methylase